MDANEDVDDELGLDSSCADSVTPSPLSDDDSRSEMMIIDGSSTPIYAVPYAIAPTSSRVPRLEGVGNTYSRVKSVRNSASYFDFCSTSSSSDSECSDLEGEESMGEEPDTTSCSSWAPVIAPSKAPKSEPMSLQREIPYRRGVEECSSTLLPITSAAVRRVKRPSEVDFLAELDQQIAELQVRPSHWSAYNQVHGFQVQSDAVRQLVEQAKERHEMRSRTRQLCMEHLQELRKMRWVMHRNFELCL